CAVAAPDGGRHTEGGHRGVSRWSSSLRWQHALFWLAVFGIGGVLIAVVVAASGIYNVAASRPHFAVTDAFIRFALKRSIVVRSRGVAVPELEKPGLVHLG